MLGVRGGGGTSVAYGRGGLGTEGIVPHSGRFHVVPRVPVRMRTGGAQVSSRTLESGVATASRCVEGYRTPDEALVC